MKNSKIPQYCQIDRWEIIKKFKAAKGRNRKEKSVKYSFIQPRWNEGANLNVSKTIKFVPCLSSRAGLFSGFGH